LPLHDPEERGAWLNTAPAGGRNPQETVSWAIAAATSPST
jgi:hypothetical protein